MQKRKLTLVSFLAGMLMPAVMFTYLEGSPSQDRKTTAGQVEDPESLKAFVEGAKGYLEGINTLTETAKLHDILMVEGEWKSGTMFLVILLKNGAVLIHGDDPRIENKLLTDVEDDKGKKVVQEFLAAADRGGDFVEYHWEDPSVDGDHNPKTSYAVEFTSRIFGKNLVLVGGYYQDVLDMAVEHSQIPSPEITAREVVDRESLKAFVKAAVHTYQEALLSDDDSELPHVQNAFKVEGGDWKHGAIYIFIVSSDGFVLLHAADLVVEGKNLIDLEDVNGYKIISGLIEAATTGGGYVEYYWPLA